MYCMQNTSKFISYMYWEHWINTNKKLSGQMTQNNEYLYTFDMTLFFRWHASITFTKVFVTDVPKSEIWDFFMDRKSDEFRSFVSIELYAFLCYTNWCDVTSTLSLCRIDKSRTRGLQILQYYIQPSKCSGYDDSFQILTLRGWAYTNSTIFSEQSYHRAKIETFNSLRPGDAYMCQ